MNSLSIDNGDHKNDSENTVANKLYKAFLAKEEDQVLEIDNNTLLLDKGTQYFFEKK